MRTVPILDFAGILVASLREGLNDTEWRALRDDLLQRAGDIGVRGVVIDVSMMDVLDSYATRVLRQMAEALRLRGARAILVGIRPAVAVAMTQLGLTLPGVETALDFGDAQELFSQAMP